ncbi:MAG: hypothetical protein ACYC3H_00340 [Bellilinea sp.]
MKKLILSMSVLVVVVLAFSLGTTSTVSAQAGTPQGAAAGNASGYGMGGRGARGGMAVGQAGVAHTQDGILHDAMIEVYAEELGISVDDLNVKLASGETLADIAFAAGLTAEEFTVLRTDARTAAVAQAVADGSLTQEQADWMAQRSGGAMRGGFGARGAGLGLNANLDCPYGTAVQP